MFLSPFFSFIDIDIVFKVDFEYRVYDFIFVTPHAITVDIYYERVNYTFDTNSVVFLVAERIRHLPCKHSPSVESGGARFESLSRA